MMKSIKKGIAVFLAVALLMPNSLVVAYEDPDTEECTEIDNTLTDTEEINETSAVNETLVTEENTQKETSELKSVEAETVQVTLETEFDEEISTEAELTEEDVKQEADTITFNTGNSVRALSDSFFQEDGSYTIDIPEKNPFFPYEVQFTYDGKTTNEWFMTPNDSVTVGGHTFCVKADFDNTVVTQMSLNVAGKTVVVYPEKKAFKDNGFVDVYSLLPLEEKRLRVDLRDYTPVELTMVRFDKIFEGSNQITDMSKIMCTYEHDGDEYVISAKDIGINLSYSTYYNSETYWQMIVGVADQLAGSNIRYIVDTQVTPSEKWLVPTVYKQDKSGVRTKVPTSQESYTDYDWNNRWNDLWVSNRKLSKNEDAYLSLQINPEIFKETGFSAVKVFEGTYETAADLSKAKEITNEIWNTDMTKKDAGYTITSNSKITIVSYDSAGKITGCLPLSMYIGRDSYSVNYSSLYDKDGNYVVYSKSTKNNTDGSADYTLTLYKDYPVNGIYKLRMNMNAYLFSTSDVKAYVGKYDTIAQAQAANAQDIGSVLFDTGYEADYSKGVAFTAFFGADTTEHQEKFYFTVKTVAGKVAKPTESGIVYDDTWLTDPSISGSSSTLVDFTGFSGIDSNKIYLVPYGLDSYGEFNYITFLVDGTVDISKLKPEFSKNESINLYVNGTAQTSGQNEYDFSKGAIQYTAASENGSKSENYWIQVKRVENGAGKLYLNSFADDAAKTTEQNGIIRSTRELIFDGYHKYQHDILIANTGTQALPKLSAELTSNTLELDEYWTLKGEYDLNGTDTLQKDMDKPHSELKNLARIRLKLKDNADAKKNISGTLTIKSGDTTLAVLNLTGRYGDPAITTIDIPQAVKYVPYGSIIRNNNKYKRNETTYTIYRGSLPDGMILRKNGELYGVPRYAGTYKFTVRMENSLSELADSDKQFTLMVKDNGDTNVNSATDNGYAVTTRIPNLPEGSHSDQLFVSEGVYTEFTAAAQNVFLDGHRLEPGKDFISESGSTRITIKAETIDKAGKGKHTLGVEFRTDKTDNNNDSDDTKAGKSLMKAAQNFNIGKTGGGGSSSGGVSSSGGGSSSNSSMSSNSKTNITVTADSIMETVVDDIEYYSVILPSDDAILRLSFFNKIYGDNAKILAYLSNGVGYSLNMNAFLSAGKDLNLSTKETELEGFAQGFKTIWLSIAEKTKLSYDLSVNLAAGAEYIGHPAYIFIFDDMEGRFVPYTETFVSEIGNVAFNTRYLTDFIIMIAQ